MPHGNTPTKKCTRCQEVLPATSEYFALHKNAGRGLRKWCKVCVREYEEQNPHNVGEQAREYLREYRSRPDNKDRFAQYRRRWAKANTDRIRIHRRLRRALQRNAQGTHTAADIEAQYKRQKGRCYYCSALLGKTYDVDHVVPLSRGGSNGPENLVCACPSCNRSKNNKLPHEWPQGGRLL